MANAGDLPPPPVVRLKYRPGETIIKEGDYGISIYHIVDGKVEIVSEAGTEVVRLAVLEKGEVIGEMTFLTGHRNPRTASVRAMMTTVVEAWHPDRISQEYQEMPEVIKVMANQIVRRLVRANAMVKELAAIKEKKKKKQQNPWESKRRYYRKKVDIECLYRPTNAPPKVQLWGQIKDISMGGLQMEISEVGTFTYSHEPGEEFIGSSFLPSGKRLDFTAKVVKLRKSPKKGKLLVGISYRNLSESAAKALGFFLMP